MFHRVQANLSFIDPDEANDFFHDCELAHAKSQVINSGQDNEEPSFVTLHKCFHDETPNLPCELIQSL